MILKLVQLGVLGIALATISAPTAQAAAFVDPMLANASGKTTVIITFKDRTRLPDTRRSLVSYSSLRRALEANARASQQDVVKMLNSERRISGNVRFTPFWIVNAMVAQLPAEQISKLRNHPDVRAIYANREVHLIEDYRGHARERLGDPFTYGLSIMNIPELRKEVPKADGQGVVVGIIDTGVDASHPDLKGKVIGFRDFAGNRKEPYDDHGHGTHVSGTIAGGNASGTAIGVAPNAKIIMAKAFSASGGSSTATLLSAMQWIADPDGNPATKDQPMLVSNSWGGGPPSPSTDPADEMFCQAVSSWLKLGIFPVFAAGNSGPRAGSVGSPGACPQSYAIGATDANDTVASFSSRGPVVWKTGTLQKPNVSAPGVNVLSAAPGGKYQTMSGTSMATPHVAGLLTLIYQVMPNISIDDAAKLVAKTTKDLGPTGSDPDYGAGRVDALSAVKAAQTFRARAMHSSR
ncbi:MAG: S8 family serine peptidase [Bdellovibrionales bacterium]|nr:S8 family serine peptidase [Bdellovibrionales bacterium]